MARPAQPAGLRSPESRHISAQGRVAQLASRGPVWVSLGPAWLYIVGHVPVRWVIPALGTGRLRDDEALDRQDR